jgi:hypothetical protein
MQRLALVLTAIVFLSLGYPLCRAAAPPDIESLTARIRAVGNKGKGHREAIDAYRELSRAGADQLLEILAGFDGAGPLAQNWLRAAVDTITERQLNGGGALPADQLEAFIRDQENPPRARSLAYDWLLRVDPEVRNRLLPGLLDDPSSELRRAAVVLAIEEAGRLDPESNRQQLVSAYRKALTAARDLDQVNDLAERLKKLGQQVDLPTHFGFLVEWQVIGPFDNEDRKGFHTAFPPEKQLDSTARYEGPFGEIAWKAYRSTDRLGQVDLNAALGNRKKVTGYAWTEYDSPHEQEVEIRWSSRNATKLWLNGTLLAEHEVYHSGGAFDQYRVNAKLKQGRNEILVKVCQNEQTQSWTNNWEFQLRVCDHNGTAISAANRPGTGDQ